jgi:TonB family protein
VATAELAAEVAAALDDPETAVVFSVAFDSLGVPRLPRVLEPALAEEEARALAAVAAAWLKPRPAARAHSVLMRVGPEGVEVGRNEHCPPSLANPREVQDALNARLRAHIRSRPDARSPQRPTLVDIRIDSLGVATETRIYQLSGMQEFDRIALEVALLMRFHPARSNGMAVPIWVRLPITLEIREDKEDPFPLIPPDPRPGQRRG